MSWMRTTRTCCAQSQLTDENRPDVQQYFEELGEIGQTYVDELSDIDPPAEAEALHEDSIVSYHICWT